MRILGFSEKWPKLKQPIFTTFRFARKDKDWAVNEEVQIVYKPRSKEREVMGRARIINRHNNRFLFQVGVTTAEAIADGFESIEEMGKWLDKTYGHRWLDEPMNKLTLRWIE